MASVQKKHDIADDSRTPLLNESMKEFFARTQAHWSKEGEKLLKPEDDAKELRRIAFGLAQERFESLKEVLGKLKSMEEEQKAADR
jgi:type VI protein secretion system component VasK